jgi:4-hydroxybenzoate polyprenyltransferase
VTYLVTLTPILAVLVFEHWLVRPSDLKRANAAFFNANAIVGLGVMAALLLDLYLR